MNDLGAAGFGGEVGGGGGGGWGGGGEGGGGEGGGGRGGPLPHGPFNCHIATRATSPHRKKVIKIHS